MRHPLPSILAILALLSQVGPVNGASPATGFRLDGSGCYPAATPALTWSVDSNILWKTELPNWSNASPLPVGSRLFACCEPDTLVCLEAATGRILWQGSAGDVPSPAPRTHEANGYTSPSPCSDGQHVWAVFGTGVAACWTLEGKRVWTTTLQYPPHGWGGCISPRLAGGHVIVQFNQMFGLDPDTGAIAWKSDTDWGWGTPVVALAGGTEVLYTCKGASIDPASGKVLGTGLLKLEFNSPGLGPDALYFLQQHPQAYALPGHPGEALKPLWNGTTIAPSRYYASPLVHDGLVYAINQGGQLAVIEARSGQVVYQKRLDYLQGTVYSSPTLAGRQVFFFSEKGTAVVIEAGRSYHELARNQLEATRACPVFEGNRMYVRGLKHLWCVATR